ncbi:hypothetical protein ACS0TY_035694 [Phlomoides rotata]
MLSCNILSNDTVVEEIVESDVELDNSDLVEPDNDTQQKIEETDEFREVYEEINKKALMANLEGKHDKAKKFLTIAIKLNPKSPMLFARRASVFAKLKKPNAAIRDANVALKMNAKYTEAYKARGMARALLGLWEDAAKDLRMVLDIYSDEETAVVLRKVESNLKKIEEHRLKYERLRKENELRKIEHEKKRRQEAEAASVLKDGEIIKINSARELEVKLNAASKLSRLTIIYFTATWCGPCLYVAPVCLRLAKKYPEVVFLKVNIDEAMDIAAEWNISSIPCFFYVKNGKVIDKVEKEIDTIVRVNKNSLEEKIVRHAG